MKNKITAVLLSFLMTAAAAVNIMADKADIPYVNYNLRYDGANHAYNAQEVYIYINGEKVNNDALPMPPVIMGGNTLVPAREVFEKLGASVAWKSDKYEVDVSYGNTFVVMYIGNTQAMAGGEQKTMNVAPQLKNDKTMIPLRFVSEAVGIDVEWEDETRSIKVNEKKEEKKEEVKEPVIEDTKSENNESIKKEETKEEKKTVNKSTPVTKIDKMVFDETSISGIELPKYTNSVFKINADDKIGQVNHFKDENGKLIIDIYNARNKIEKEIYTATNSSMTEVRVNERDENGIKVTRFEVAIESDALYEISLSEDRKSVIVSFKENNVHSITLSTNDNGDAITITADRAVELNAERTTDPDRLIFDIKNTRLTIDDGSLGDGKFSKNVRFSQYGSNKVRIAIDLDKKYNYKQSVVGNVTTILIMETPQASDITYDHDNNLLKIGKNGKKVNINNFKHRDDYLNLIYEITFDENVYGEAKTKEFVVEDDDMLEVDVNSSSEGTVVTFYEQRILAYVVTEDESYIYIKAVEPKEKYDKIVVLDAGHGGSDCGAIGWGLYEEDITLDITNKIIAIAEKDNKMKVYCSRTTDVLPTFDERTDMGNEVGDVFVSVHINSAGANTAPHGTEVYMLNENTTANGLTSSMLAGTLLNNLVEYLGSVNRGVKSENFIVLRQSYNPAVLCEIGFITNEEEAGKLGTDEYRQRTAQAIYDGCLYLLENYGR